VRALASLCWSGGITPLSPYQSCATLSDENTTSMHRTIFEGWKNEGRKDQHCFPRWEGGPKLIRLESPRWRSNSSSSPPRCLGSACTKNDAQAVYGVRFGRSLYGWKDNLKELPIAPVSGPNSLVVNGNRQNKRMSKIWDGTTTPSFGLLARISCWGPLWTWLRGYVCPKPHIISSRRQIRFRVLFEFSFPSRNWIVHYNCVY